MNNTIRIQLPGVRIFHPTACVVVISYDNECNITLELAKQITSEVRQLYNDGPIGVVHSAGLNTTLDPGVREYLSSNSRYPNKVAEAFVVKNLSQRIIANFYLRVSRHSCPTEVFNDEQEAVKWVKMFCRKSDGGSPCPDTLTPTPPFGAN